MENAAHELREGLKCHDSISRLKSKDQFYEFVLAVQRISLICKEPIVMKRVGTNIGLTLEKLAKLLYEHHCLFPQQIKHTKWSKMLIDVTLSLLDLPAIPVDDELVMIDSYIPVVEVKQHAVVRSLPLIGDERIKAISDIIEGTGDEPRSRVAELSHDSVKLSDMTTYETCEEEDHHNFRAATTAEEDPAARAWNQPDTLNMINDADFRNMQTWNDSPADDIESTASIRGNETLNYLEESLENAQLRFPVLKESQQNVNSKQQLLASIRCLETESSTVESCYATAENESVQDRGMKVLKTIKTLETSSRSIIDWNYIDKSHSGQAVANQAHSEC